MPELPVLGPAGPVQIGGDLPKIPKRLPISEALSAGTQDVATQLFELAKGIRAQKLRQTDASATIKYTEQLNELRKQTAKLPDLDQQEKFFETGINKIQDAFRGDAPNLGTLTTQSIADKISNDYREFALKNTEQKYKKGIADVHQSTEDFKRLIVASDDKKTQQVLQSQALKLIDDTQKNGFLDGPTAKAMKDKFLTDTRVALFTRLAHEHPEEAMKMTAGDVPIPPTQFYNIQNQAYQTLTNKQSLGRAHFEATKNGYLTDLAAHPEKAQEYAHNQWVTPSEASMIAGRRIEVNPPNGVEVAHWQDKLQNFKGPVQDYDNYYIRTVLPAIEGMDAGDRAQINREYTDNRRELTSSSRNHALDIRNEIQDTIMDSEQSSGADFMSGVFAKPIINYRKRTLGSLKRELDDAKTTQEMDKIREKYLKQIPEWYNTHYGKPSEAKKPTEPEGKATPEPDASLRD